MILSSHGIIGSQIVQGFDLDYQAILDYATTQGYTLPSESQQLLQNQLVKDLKTGGVWSRLESFGVFATDGSQDFASIDWKRLSQYTRVNTPGFTTNQGFIGDGTSKYINFNYIWGSAVSTSNASMGQYYFSGTPTLSDIMGSRSSVLINQSIISPSSFRLFCNTVSAVYTPSLGIDIHVRDGANSGFLRNGGTNYTQTGLVNQSKGTFTNFGLSAINNNASAQFFGTSNGIPISMSFFGQSLTTTQAASFDTSFSTYITSL
jgi:hypothetical protein